MKSQQINKNSILKANQIQSLPMLTLMPHSGCNCKCIMCDIWKGNKNAKQLSVEDINGLIDAIEDLDVRLITLSGGEAMLNQNVWDFCKILRGLNLKISLMSTGLTLSKNAANVVKWCDAITISLDGSRSVHDEIRRIPKAFDLLSLGIQEIKKIDKDFPVVVRCCVQKENYKDLPYIIHAAKSIKADMISFLPADVSTEAFNRPDGWEDDRVSEIALSREETRELALIVENIIERYSEDFESGFIFESKEKFRSMVQHYQTLNGENNFPEVKCNAPWVSAVIEADLTVRPCFFHEPYGNLKNNTLDELINSEEAIKYRSELDVSIDPRCQGCVCSLYIPK